MKYAIWRHENALGNSGEQLVNLSDFIQKQNDKNPEIYAETDFQKDFALCIPNVTESSVHFFDKNQFDLDNFNKHNYKEQLKDVYMPDVYFGDYPKRYPSTWSTLKYVSKWLRFPKYKSKHNLPKDSIVINFREPHTYYKRVEGAYCEPNRYVNPQTFIDLALHYANKGIKVVRVGDEKQTPMPEHENIIDFALVKDRRMLDDLYAVQHSKVYVTTDSGIWPVIGGLRHKMVFTNIVAGSYKPDVVNWLIKDVTKFLYKNGSTDNTFEEIIKAVDELI